MSSLSLFKTLISGILRDRSPGKIYFRLRDGKKITSAGGRFESGPSPIGIGLRGKSMHSGYISVPTDQVVQAEIFPSKPSPPSVNYGRGPRPPPPTTPFS